MKKNSLYLLVFLLLAKMDTIFSSEPETKAICPDVTKLLIVDAIKVESGTCCFHYSNSPEKTSISKTSIMQLKEKVSNTESLITAFLYRVGRNGADTVNDSARPEAGLVFSTKAIKMLETLPTDDLARETYDLGYVGNFCWQTVSQRWTNEYQNIPLVQGQIEVLNLEFQEFLKSKKSKSKPFTIVINTSQTGAQPTSTTTAKWSLSQVLSCTSIVVAIIGFYMLLKQSKYL